MASGAEARTFAEVFAAGLKPPPFRPLFSVPLKSNPPFAQKAREEWGTRKINSNLKTNRGRLKKR